MNTVLIIVCILFCIGVVVGIVGHLGYGITRDKAWRVRIQRHHRARRRAGAS
ncbi:MAG: hypothetical protein JO325_03735 [Solirubrobacterales bacterium]|nr:hypothetical protein [Solirubrobacterales bacterium]